ncbi:MAG: ABC transporter permease [Burkholderiaceae bacterium]|nr:MAG: ABC transporter permease [Burkholderiaceae bacterium]
MHLAPNLAKITQEQLVFAAAVLLFFVFSLAIPGFSTLGNLSQILERVTVVGIFALGASIVVISGGLDLSQVGSAMAGGGMTVLLLNSGWSLPLSLAAGLLVCVFIGIINGYIIAFVEIPDFFATLATNLLIFGVARLLIFSHDFRIYLNHSALQSFFFTILGARLLAIPVTAFIFLLLVVLLYLFMRSTTIGRTLYAIGDNSRTARENGVPIRSYTILKYTLSAIFGYIAALAFLSTIHNIDAGVMIGTMIFDVILIVVLGGVSLVGGRGTPISVLIGTILIGLLLNGMTLLNLNNDLQDVARGAVLLIAIVVDNRLHPRNEETARKGE